MKLLTRLSAALAGVLLLACMLACGAFTKVRDAADRVKRSNDLKQIGLTYHEYNTVHQKAPANHNDLVQHAQKSNPEAVSIIQMAGPGGKYVILWGNNIPRDFPDGMSLTVLGYESVVPSSGGLVLMGDGVVQMMTAAEFAQAKKAKSK